MTILPSRLVRIQSRTHYRRILTLWSDEPSVTTEVLKGRRTGTRPPNVRQRSQRGRYFILFLVSVD